VEEIDNFDRVSANPAVIITETDAIYICPPEEGAAMKRNEKEGNSYPYPLFY